MSLGLVLLRTLSTRAQRERRLIAALKRGDDLAAMKWARAGVGRSVLESVLQEGSVALTRELIHTGVSLDLKAGGLHPLWQAYCSRRESVEKFGLLVTSGCNPDGFVGLLGTRLLHWACYSGELPLVHLLLSARADVNRRDRHGLLAVAYARLGGQTQAIQECLRAGSADETASMADAERVLISGQGFVSQVHESLKSGFRFAEVSVSGFEVRPGMRLTYRFKGGALEFEALPSEGRLRAGIEWESGRRVDLLRNLPGGSISLRDLMSRTIDALRSPGAQQAAEAAGQPDQLATLEGFRVAAQAGDASADELSQAYRRLAKKYHPDALIGASEAERREGERRMVELNLAKPPRV